MPVVEVFRSHKRSLVLGTFAALATFVLFYLVTVFALSYNVGHRSQLPRTALLVQLVGSCSSADHSRFPAFSPSVGRRAVMV